jgi:hypothetical protein
VKLLLALAVAGLAWAQSDATKPEIRGVVIEPGIERGIPGVDITIFEAKGPEIRRRASQVVTDSQGKFRIRPEQFGEYEVTAIKGGYGGNLTSAHVTLSADHPSLK